MKHAFPTWSTIGVGCSLLMLAGAGCTMRRPSDFRGSDNITGNLSDMKRLVSLGKAAKAVDGVEDVAISMFSGGTSDKMGQGTKKLYIVPERTLDSEVYDQLKSTVTKRIRTAAPDIPLMVEVAQVKRTDDALDRSGQSDTSKEDSQDSQDSQDSSGS
ncbi:hypothetical protein [Pasteuria penetrans]|uniref:hypothetical protein n=1 Tax=Pasteuria penetrans TaxID=86005 RepID=UPI000F931B7C|nr:hypothetical protein [Pasteuria penetrans]